MSLSLDGARRLMAPATPTPVVYSLADVEKHVGVRYNRFEQRVLIDAIPFSEETLKACAGTHMLFPSFPLSLLEIRNSCEALFYAKHWHWYAEDRQQFSRRLTPVRWHLMRTGPVLKSFEKTWGEQTALLAPSEEVPSAAVVASATVLHFLASGQRLFDRCYVRTSDLTADGDHVGLGGFDADGIRIHYYWDDVLYGGVGLGLASSRKVP